MVYRKLGSSSISRFPRSACRLQNQNHAESASTIRMINRLHLQSQPKGSRMTGGAQSDLRDRGIHSRSVLGRVLVAKHQAAHDPTQAT